MSDNNQLSDRELEILKLVATGASNKEIANNLVISVNTVKVHLRNIFSKLEVSSRTEATMWAVRAGIVSSEFNAAELGSSGSVEEEQQSWSRRYGWMVVGGIFVLFVIFASVLWFLQWGTSNGEEFPGQTVESERWQELASLSTPRSRFAFVAYENQLYTIGGQTDSQLTNLVERYDPQQDEWTTLAPKPVPVVDVSAAMIGGKIYVPGGQLETGAVTNIVEVYDPKEDNWQTVSSLPQGLSAYAMTAFEGKLYLFGGWNGTEFVDSVYEYDPDDGIWTEQEPMLTARGFSGAAVSGEKIYILGGYDGKRAFDLNEIFSPGNPNEPWSIGQPLPQGRYGMGVTSLAETIYVLGGETEKETVTTSFQYRPSIDEWISLSNLFAETWSHMGIASLATNIYIFGGNLDGLASDQMWYYQAIYTISIPVIQQ